MAPRPQTTQTGAPTSPSQSSSSSGLPGMKRGIAIGVAVSVATILIALLAYCAVQRRKKAKKSKARIASQYSDTEAWPKDQKWPIESPVVEADVATIHELDATPVPELASTHPAQELEGEKSPISELDSTKPASIHESHTEKLLEWRSWNRALQARRSAENVSDQQHPSRRDLPTLSISPPDNSESTLGLSPLGSSPMGGVSPIAVSPLDEVYFPNRRFSIASPVLSPSR